jgi:hypothetical protein
VPDDQGGATWQKSELRGTVDVAGSAGTLRNTGAVSDALSLM